MKIAVIGSGDVGKALAKGLESIGHSVMIGTRDTSKKDLAWAKKKSNKVQLGSFAEAADFGEIILLAVAWHATENVLAIIRPEAAGKVVIDVTNPLVFNDDGPPELEYGHDMSAGELVQQTLADSHVVKTLNIINYKNMVNPKYKDGKPIMFLCGNNDAAKRQVSGILTDFGWQVVQDLGGIEKSRLLEPLCLLWIEYGVANNTWNHAFSVLEN